MRTKETRRCRLTKEHHRALIAEMRVKGRIHEEIASELSISRSQVSRDLKLIRKRWAERAHTAISEHIAEEVAKIDAVEREAFSAWERSCENFAEKTVEETGGAREGRKYRVTTKERTGNPRFLEVIGRCIERRCKLLGLFEERPVDLNLKVLKVPIKSGSAEEWEQAFGRGCEDV